MPIIILTILLLSCLSSSLTAKSEDVARLKMYYGLAEGHYLTGNLSAAKKSLEEILRLDPSHTAALELQARILLSSGQDASQTTSNQVHTTLQAIEQKLDQTDVLDSQNTNLRLSQAKLLARSGDIEAAIRALQFLTSQQPGNLEATLTLAALYAASDRWASVEQLIPALLDQPALTDVALYLEGRAAYSQGRIGRAREKFEAALDEQPARANRLSPFLYFYRSLCLDALKRTEEAHADLFKALEAGFRPESTKEALITAAALLRHKEPTQAIPILEGLTLNSLTQDAEAWSLLGRAHRLKGSTALALSAFNESLRLNPIQPKTLALRAGLLRQINDHEGALNDYIKAQTIDPQNPALHYALGLCYLQLEAIPQATDHLETAAEKLPKQKEIRLLTALLQFTERKNNCARQSLESYFDSTAEPNTTALNLAYLLNLDIPMASASDFSLYSKGKLSREACLDQVAIATNPKKARQQIAATAFCMAHSPRSKNEPLVVQELLHIAAKTGSAEQPEAICARWLLSRTPPAQN